MTDPPDFGDPDINTVYATADRLLRERETSVGDWEIAESTGLDLHSVRAALMFLGGASLTIEPFLDGSIAVRGEEE
jgi:hypothetical protein